jgi:hypothetical protein
MLSLSSHGYADFFAVDFEMLLSAELGTFENGDPAICVIPPDAPMRGHGLHVYIDKFATRISSGTYQQRVSLVQFDRSQPGADTLQSALQKLHDRYPPAREIPLPYRKETTLEVAFLIPISTNYLGSSIPIVPRSS